MTTPEGKALRPLLQLGVPLPGRPPSGATSGAGGNGLHGAGGRLRRRRARRWAVGGASDGGASAARSGGVGRRTPQKQTAATAAAIAIAATVLRGAPASKAARASALQRRLAAPFPSAMASKYAASRGRHRRGSTAADTRAERPRVHRNLLQTSADSDPQTPGILLRSRRNRLGGGNALRRAATSHRQGAGSRRHVREAPAQAAGRRRGEAVRAAGHRRRPGQQARVVAEREVLGPRGGPGPSEVCHRRQSRRREAGADETRESGGDNADVGIAFSSYLVSVLCCLPLVLYAHMV